MTPYERLMAEAVPTGTFGHARPTRRRDDEPTPAWTREEQAAHLAALEAAIGTKPTRRPRLRVIDGHATATRPAA